MANLRSLDWKRLADYVKAGRLALDVTQDGLAEKAGVAVASLQSIERGTPRTRIPGSAIKVESALGWAPGSVRAILSGGDPEPVAALPKVRVEFMSGDVDRVAAAIASYPGMSSADKARLLRDIAGSNG